MLFRIFCAWCILMRLPVTWTMQRQPARSFAIDYDNDTFVMDGKPFQYVSGSFHYFRALPQSWQPILSSMRAAGLNAVTTYVEWSLHNPKENEYNWDGMADIVHFIELAMEEDLYVILRPGPYICAERDMGGFPAWLLHKYPGIQLRTNDINYLREVRSWYAQLFSRLARFMFGQGGPIILVQVENEYGSYFACDHKYLNWLRDETARYVKGDAVLFTNNGPGLETCGAIEGVLSTLDFGPGTGKSDVGNLQFTVELMGTMRFSCHYVEDEINGYWTGLRKTQPKGPLVNAEFYPGWLTHWQEAHMAHTDAKLVADSLAFMLRNKVNVNIYMFFGGTNYGFTAGANSAGSGGYVADITSYDYDAPLSECGDPTEKYYTLRDTILQYFPRPNVSLPLPTPKMKINPVSLFPLGSLLDPVYREKLTTINVTSDRPLTFEALNQVSGLVLYEATIPDDIRTDPYKLTVEGVHDRAYVFVDKQFMGVLSRENLINSMPIGLDKGRTLSIVVENQGRINFGIANDFKGIVGKVYINMKEVLNWTMYGIPLEEFSQLKQSVLEHRKQTGPKRRVRHDKWDRVQPMLVYYGIFDVFTELADTYLDAHEFGKGVVFINGINIGRYWPLVGPQKTLYVSRHILKPKDNYLILIEYQKESETLQTLYFTDAPIFN